MENEFLKHISKNSNGCWEWTKKIYSHGYGVFWYQGKSYRAHRASFLLFKGELIKGLVIDHKCRNRRCVNPEHLRQVTTRENLLENSEALAFFNSIKTHCPKGHEYIEENLDTYAKSRGKRLCIKCKLLKTSAWLKINRDKNNENRRDKRKFARSIG